MRLDAQRELLGLERFDQVSSAPALNPMLLSTMSPLADKNMMGTLRPSSRMVPQISNPFVSGSMTSRMRKSGRSARSMASPSSPPPAQQ